MRYYLLPTYLLFLGISLFPKTSLFAQEANVQSFEQLIHQQYKAYKGDEAQKIKIKGSVSLDNQEVKILSFIEAAGEGKEFIEGIAYGVTQYTTSSVFLYQNTARTPSPQTADNGIHGSNSLVFNERINGRFVKEVNLTNSPNSKEYVFLSEASNKGYRERRFLIYRWSAENQQLEKLFETSQKAVFSNCDNFQGIYLMDCSVEQNAENMPILVIRGKSNEYKNGSCKDVISSNFEQRFIWNHKRQQFLDLINDKEKKQDDDINQLQSNK